MVIRWITPPPSFPILIEPWPSNWTKHIAPHYGRTHPFICFGSKSIIDARGSTFVAEHCFKCSSCKCPIHDCYASLAKGILTALIRGRSKSVQRHGESSNNKFSQSFLLCSTLVCNLRGGGSPAAIEIPNFALQVDRAIDLKRYRPARGIAIKPVSCLS